MQRDGSNKSGKIYGIYTHATPDGGVFYVGKGTYRRAFNFLTRSVAHKEMIRVHGRNNIIVTFKACESEQAALAEEVSLINHYRTLGHVLVNKTDGGEGVSGYRHTGEAIEKMREASKDPVLRAKITAAMGRAETKAKLRAVRLSPEIQEKMLAVWNSPGFRKKHGELISKNMKGRKKSTEHKEKIRITLTGKKLSPEHRASIKAAVNRPEVKAKLIATLNRPEVRAKRSAAHAGKKQSPEAVAANRAAQNRPEVKAKISAALRGRKRTPEHAAKLSAAQKGRKLSPERIAAIKAGKAKAKLLSTTTEGAIL